MRFAKASDLWTESIQTISLILMLRFLFLMSYFFQLPGIESFRISWPIHMHYCDAIAKGNKSAIRCYRKIVFPWQKSEPMQVENWTSACSWWKRSVYIGLCTFDVCQRERDRVTWVTRRWLLYRLDANTMIATACTGTCLSVLDDHDPAHNNYVCDRHHLEWRWCFRLRNCCSFDVYMRPDA